MAEKKKTLKEKIKSVHKKFKDVAASGALGTGGFRRKKEKEEADPNETFGGRIKLDEPRIQTKGGSELISPKRKQGPLPKTPTLKFAGGGRAGYKGGNRVGSGKSMGNLPTPIRMSLVKQAKDKLKPKKYAGGGAVLTGKKVGCQIK
jgi:hypothetical protein|tara:strand:- start:162 stop:602 length:441 start_codon:yes stop_codon:yes gene_type:complete